ncbi:putative cytochrome c oxidase assembly protein 1 -like [Scophthalmus maximus]|uniref:Putative cytochrome c oxidase assembly protein 1-like n=1 Tax=Scophthalmus maximus TaxID=52904 RepID=A0A2U9BM09_SCOMX|nr:cytochrome c oxidase assembly factor 1 homolog [Scophthalmus maximus]XP_035491263.1 cytochrome c oxidase assembly factor 1 homolog [Scophthalmus maximus]XP_035491264.1 cytochrome c oxidase assembly factor 1 homolog [Scophthalmus maximus]AWP04706.1 putative cytochrome c oxidase assembly protein 1 -like [Scophthalmus maximus]
MRITNRHLKKFAVVVTLVYGAEFGALYYVLQKEYTESGCKRRALQKLEACTAAVESLGGPPLKVYSLNLIDKYNRLHQDTAQVKIPVAGSKTNGYLYTSAVKDPYKNRWSLRHAVLKLKEGQVFTLLSPYPAAKAQSQAPEHVKGIDTGHW